MQQYGFICVWPGTIFFTNFNGQTGIKTLCAQSMLYIHRNHCQKEFKQCFYFCNFLILHVICTKKEANKQILLQQQFRKIYSESI